MSAPATYQRFTSREDRIVARRRYSGVPAKVVARELGRTHNSINNRFASLQRKLARAHGDVLERHREEELRLLDELLGESRAKEQHGDEVQ